MKTRSLVAASSIGLMCLFAVRIAAEAAELNVLSALGMQAVMDDLAPKFERASGHRLVITFALLGVAVKRVQDGEPADIVIIPQQGIDSLVKDGRVSAANVTVVAHSGIGLAVRKGAPKPDVSSPEALKRTLLAAKSITHYDPATGGASAVHFVTVVLERLGIANEMKPRTVFPEVPGAAGFGREVANGEVEIAVNQIQELLSVDGIEVVGPLPSDLQRTTVFSAALMGSANNIAGAKALVDFLRTPEAVAVIRAKGMEPATP